MPGLWPGAAGIGLIGANRIAAADRVPLVSFRRRLSTGALTLAHFPASVAITIAVPFHRDSRVVRRFIGFSRVIAGLMIVFALAVLAGWWWDVRLLTTVVSGQRSMKADAAIGFFLSGSALLLSHGFSRMRSRTGPALSLVVMGIGLTTLAEYVGSVDLGIASVR